MTSYNRGRRTWSFVFPLLLLAQCRMFGQTASLALSSGAAVAGGATVLTLTLAAPANNLPVGLQWTLSYSTSDVASVTVDAGATVTAAGKLVSCNGTSGSLVCLAYGV